MTRFLDSFVRVRPAWKTTIHNQRVADWDNADRHLYERSATIQPRSTTETTLDDRNQVVTGWRLSSRPGVTIDLGPTDRIEWNGRLLEVIGDVAAWPHPIRPDAVHHIEVDLQRVSG
jgi:hypothetical protein